MSVLTMITEAVSTVPEVSVEQLQRELAAGKVLLLDVRDLPERWAQGTIRGAMHVSRGTLEWYADPRCPYHQDRPFLDPNRRTITFSMVGERSAVAAHSLLKLGYRDVASFAPGLFGWIAAGLEIEAVPVQTKFPDLEFPDEKTMLSYLSLPPRDGHAAQK